MREKILSFCKKIDVFGIILFGISLYFVFNIKKVTGVAKLSFIGMFVIPTLLYFIVDIWSIKSPLNEIKEVKNFIIGVKVLLGISAFFCWMTGALAHDVASVTDPSLYSYAREEARGDIGDHFPDELPEDAKNAQLYYTPGPMQASPILNLYFKASEETIDSYIERYEKEAINIEPLSANYNEISGWFFYNTPYMDLFDGNTDEATADKIYEGFMVYYLEAGGGNEHGRENFIAVVINDETNEVLFNWIRKD